MALDDSGGATIATAPAGAVDTSGFFGGATAPAAPAAPADPAAPAAPAADIAGAPDPDWYSLLSAEGDADNPANRDVVKAKGWKSPDDVVKSYREAERALRESGRVKVPGEGASEAEVATFRKAIGVPEKAEDYALPVIKGENGEPIPLNTERLSAIAAIAHKHGIPKAALEATLQELAQADTLEMASAEADMQAKVDAHLKTWGDSRAEKMANVAAAARELGLTREEQQAMRAALGPARALDLFANLGSRMAEDTMFLPNSERRFGISGAEAEKQLQQKMANADWRSKAMVPGTAERAEYDRLQSAMGQAADRAAQEAMRS